MDQQPLYYNKNCTIPFWAFDQANNDQNMKNPNVSRKFDGIYLRSLDRIQGGHDIFDLHSSRAIKRWKIIEILIPKAIVKHI